MKNIICVVLVSLLVGAPVYAEEKVFSTIIDDQPVVCFDVESAQALLQIRLDFPKTVVKLNLVQDRLVIKDGMIDELEKGTVLLQNQVDIITSQNVELLKEQDKREGFFRSPYFWSFVGLVAGIGLAIGVMYVVKPNMS